MAVITTTAHCPSCGNDFIAAFGTDVLGLWHTGVVPKPIMTCSKIACDAVVPLDEYLDTKSSEYLALRDGDIDLLNAWFKENTWQEQAL